MRGSRILVLPRIFPAPASHSGFSCDSTEGWRHHGISHFRQNIASLLVQRAPRGILVVSSSDASGGESGVSHGWRRSLDGGSGI